MRRHQDSPRLSRLRFAPPVPLSLAVAGALVCCWLHATRHAETAFTTAIALATLPYHLLMRIGADFAFDAAMRRAGDSRSI